MTDNQSPAERDAQAGTTTQVIALTRTVEEQRATIGNLEADSERLRENYGAHLTTLRESIDALRVELRDARSAPISADDDRLTPMWRKASRIANGAGFCPEYERIASSLGVPEIDHAFTASATVAVTLHVPVSVSGTASRSDITNGDLETWQVATEIDREMVADAIADMDAIDIRYAIEDDPRIYAIDDVEIEDEDE